MYKLDPEETRQIREARTSPKLESEERQKTAGPPPLVIQSKDWIAELMKKET
jgi:hypothetical protein